ncbi:MAG TPA: helix-turn-helix domain-containing protein [bacterium]|nr:helix-turn-helix domain-containing protein [bacterium]
MEDVERICPRFHKAIELIGKKWTGAIIRALMGGPRRFSEILDSVPRLHDRVLSERLRELEAEGVVKRRVYPEIPVRIEYELTEKGRDLEKVVNEFHRWADHWAPAPAKPAPDR